MTVGGRDRVMDREAPASLLCCPSIARREARGPVWGGVRSGWLVYLPVVVRMRCQRVGSV